MSSAPHESNWKMLTFFVSYGLLYMCLFTGFLFSFAFSRYIPTLIEARFCLLNARRSRIESSNSVENLIKRRLSCVYTYIYIILYIPLNGCVCVIYFFRNFPFLPFVLPSDSPISPVYKKPWINRGGKTTSDVFQKLLCLATKFNEEYIRIFYILYIVLRFELRPPFICASALPINSKETSFFFHIINFCKANV